ncbi:AzlC family ABC transporter permease [Euzebya tangerina]|uniref:AzlC family ABC transporter permease n=1 Tax=Euzebya tangerina TaxID=591198 RepID=UPI0013C2B1ED|nr:AzlC family ABC transporter permease [Euzebya tangerina]
MWSLPALVFGVSFGAVGVAGGADPLMLTVMSVVVFGPSSQFGALTILLAGGAATAALVTGLVLNSRLVALGLVISPRLDVGPIRRALAAHLVVDASVLLAIRMERPADLRRFYLESGVAVWLSWILGTMAGSVVGGSLDDLGRFGIDVALPALFLGLLAPTITDRRSRVAAAVGAVAAVATTPVLPRGIPVLLATVGAAVAVVAVDRDVAEPSQPDREPNA